MSAGLELKRLASTAFGLGLGLRSAAYDVGLFKTVGVDGVRVVSVGNSAMGGSGKTPLSIHLATQIARRGKRCAVVLRGYKGSLSHPGGIVSRGAGPLVSPEQAGDEAYLLATRLRDIPVLVGADRVAACRKARALGAEVVVLDDGFQHRRLKRDLDILLAAPEELSRAGALFPLGSLRESHKGAERAHLIGGFDDDWKEGMEKGVDFTFSFSPVGLLDRDSTTSSLETHAGTSVYLMAGIARPDRFLKTAGRAGFQVRGHAFFKDHYRFQRADLRHAADTAGALGAKMLLTTQKDLHRIPPDEIPLPLYALCVDLNVIKGADAIEAALCEIL